MIWLILIIRIFKTSIMLSLSSTLISLSLLSALSLSISLSLSLSLSLTLRPVPSLLLHQPDRTNWSHRKDAINTGAPIPLHIKHHIPPPPSIHMDVILMAFSVENYDVINTSSYLFIWLCDERFTLWVPRNIIILALRHAEKWIVFENEPGFAINYTTGFWAIVILFKKEADWINALIYVELQVAPIRVTWFGI